jgi:hypothetical protein
MRQNLNSGLPERDWVAHSDVAHALSKLDLLTVVVLNSNSGEEVPESFDDGFNIIIGGNSLSRGVTFPNLQTVYYTRDAKVKNSDTFWQHSRVFGYQRRKETVRIFMPITLISLFRVLQEANSRLISAVKSGENRLSIILPKGIVRPTRPNVIDKSAYSYVLGGTNYFPPSPNQENYDKVFEILRNLSISECELEPVDIEIAKALFAQASEDSSWPRQTFVSALVAVADRVGGKAHLIVRRERNLGRTGTMLSPDDRLLGSQNADKFLITVYEVMGDSAKGWAGTPFWMINVKLPDNLVYHHIA